MKTIKYLSTILIMFSGISIFSCKTSKGTTSSARTVEAGNYRLVISFISKGAGIDGKAHDVIKKYIDEHPKKPAAESYRWGREGEIDYCLKLDELTAKEQKTFVEEVKKLAGNTDMVQFSENAPCVHKK